MSGHALLFTDVVDSTLLVERLGDVRAAQVWAEHDRRARELLARDNGREIDRTDGFFLIFDHARDAAHYAVTYHQALAALGLNARVGLHVGLVTLHENPSDDVARGAKRTEVEGLAKPVAARVMALARGGQTLLTAAACAALSKKLPGGCETKSHGFYRFKGIEEPIEVFELGAGDSAPFIPPLDADKAYRVVHAGDLWCPAREIRHNLPAERDAFVGRAAELRALASRLDGGARLVTVLGPGGTGKTRFARRYGWTWLGDWPGGVYFCDLSEARSLDGIYFAVASALEIPLGKDDPAVQLGHAITGRGCCLMILDNFEQVLEHASATLGRWVDRAADAAFVVTSRERLHLPGEEIFPIEPLALDKAAIDLFAARARAQKPDFVIGDANRAAVTEVVRLLDGLPLAIELAAARVRILSPAQLVERMRDRFDLLIGASGATARQATLRAAIDWSWDLLTPWEQAALAQCAVFEGGFTLNAAEAVLDLSALPGAPPAMDIVQALVDKSLLRTWVPAEQSRYDVQEPYFGMYVSIREYVAEKLTATGPEAERAAEERHGRYFAGFGTESAIEALGRHGGVGRRRTLALELDNLVTACHRAIARDDADTAVATYRATWEVLEVQGPFALGAALGEDVLALGAIAPSLRATALLTRAQALQSGGRMEEAATGLDQALALSREVRDQRREGSVLDSMGILHRGQGRMAEARQHHEAALALHRELGDRRAEGRTLTYLGNLHRMQAEMGIARPHYEANLAIAREFGSRQDEGTVLNNLGILHFEQGRMDEARAHYAASLAIHRETSNRRNEGIVLGNLGILHQEQGRMEEARAHYDRALAIHRELGNRRFEGNVLGSLGNLHRDEGQMQEARAHYDAALAIHREVGNRREEGEILGYLGDLLAREGRLSEARDAFQAGQMLLRQVNDRLALAAITCIRGRAEVTAGDIDLALCALTEAETMAAEVGAGPDSVLGHEIAKLRETLAMATTRLGSAVERP